MTKKDDDHATSLALQVACKPQYLLQLDAHRALEGAVTEAAKASQPVPRRSQAITKLARQLAASAMTVASCTKYHRGATFLR